MVTRSMIAIIIILTLAIFSGVLASGQWWKRPSGEDDDVAALLDQLHLLRHAPVDWERAEMLTAQLDAAWKKVQRRIQFSVQIDDMLRFSDEIAQLQAAVEVRSQALAWRSVRLLQSLWERMR